MTQNDRNLDGGCTCGRIHYRMMAPPMFVHCCHCRWCQRETGSAFVINALIESTNLKILAGEVHFVDTPTHSARGQKIARCPGCQVALFSHYAGAGDSISFVRAGTLDAPDAVTPDVHIYTASKQGWVVLPVDTPALPGYYRASELWPAQSLERRRLLRQSQQAGAAFRDKSES